MSAENGLRCNRTLAMAVLWVFVIMATLRSSSQAEFMLAEPASSALAKKVSATCDGGTCLRTMNETSCTRQNVCQLTCPTRTDFPDTQIPLRASSLWTQPSNSAGCQVSSDVALSDIPSVVNGSNGFLNISSNSDNCSVNGMAGTNPGRLALSLWIWPTCAGNCTVARLSGNSVVLSVSGGKLCVSGVCGSSSLSSNAWTHLVLQISAGTASFAVNGVLNPAGMPKANVSVLPGILFTTLGVSSDSVLDQGDSYQLLDVRYYNDVLTFREIQQIFTGASFQNVGLLNECRCPYSHLTVDPSDPYSCRDDTNQNVKRVTTVFNEANALIDGDASTMWAAADSGGFTLTVDMEASYQVEEVSIEFQNAVPETAVLILPSSENKKLQCSNLVCSVSLVLNPGIQTVSPEVFSSRVLQYFELTFMEGKQQGQGNFVVKGITVTGRCNCNGQAASCNMSATPYSCDCDNNTQTTGRQCESCAPNRFRLPGDFHCAAVCDCEPAGVINPDQMCFMNGGACQCKSNVGGLRCDTCRNWTYNLNFSNPNGCQGCSCHQNGTVSCNKNNGSCSCKTNVAPPFCTQCREGFYDVGPAVGPDSCQLCQCDGRGVVPNSICDRQTGQCVCKQYVQGRACNECQDGHYSLQITQPRGCLDCGCNGVGSISNVCDKISGQCPCENLSPSGGKICSPKIDSVQPRYGPLAGGTLVIISGQLLGNSSKVPSVFLGNYSQSVQYNNISTIIFKTSNVTTVGAVPLKVSWTQMESALSSANFSYSANPSLNTAPITDFHMFVSGGCGVYFKGSNFLSVAVPYISVTDTSSGRSSYGTCRHLRPDLLCLTPDLKGMANRDNSKLRFGLVLDGVVYSDLGRVQVKQDPQLNDLGNYDFQYPFEKTVTISGSGLTGGCGQDEISILIGVVSCDIVSLSDSAIECKPPQNLRGTKNKPVVVKIGSNIAKQVGTLNYLQFWETTAFIGIMCGVAALILLIIVIIIVCRCRKRRNKHPANKRISRMPLVEKPSNGSAHAENSYSNLPMHRTGGITNNGFQNPVQQETVIREPKDVPPPTATEMDLLSDFLQRMESSLCDSVKSAMVSCNDLTRGRVCTNSGKYARVIDGQFAILRAGQRQEKKVTIKTLKEPLTDDDSLPPWVSAALRDCLRLHRYSNNNVLSTMGLALDTERFYIIYPYMQNRTLKDHIVDNKKEFRVRQLVEYGQQVAAGIAFLNSKDVVHKDLAARNCWVDVAEVVKIGDSAFSWDLYEDEYVYDTGRERYMPIRWMAPESLAEGYYDMRTDVWSLGVLLWEMLTRGCLPFHEVDNAQVKDYVLEGYMLGKPENCSDNLYELMKECWNAENEHRPHVSTVVKLLSEELAGDTVEQDDIYVNLGSSEDYYENQESLAVQSGRIAPPPPSYA